MHSVSRNKNKLKNKNKRGDNSNKEIKKSNIKSKRETHEGDLYTKRILNLSLNKLPVILNNTCSIYSPGLSLNTICITKMKNNSKNKIVISKNTKNDLL